MKRILGTAVLLALLAVGSFAPQASAQCQTGTGVNILLKWDANGFSYETGAPYVNYISPAGNVLTNVTSATLLCGPLSSLNPNDPAKEYTMVWTNLGSTGTVTTPFGAGSKYSTVYTGGSFALYEGPVNARAYTSSTIPVPALALPGYLDGTVILSGAIDSLTTSITRNSLGSVNGSFRGKYRITGGSYAGQFCAGNAPAALLDGLWFPVAPPAGYTGHNNGKFDAPDCTTPTQSTTWGRVKTMYR
jgi:hypothetical protein